MGKATHRAGPLPERVLPSTLRRREVRPVLAMGGPLERCLRAASPTTRHRSTPLDTARDPLSRRPQTIRGIRGTGPDRPAHSHCGRKPPRPKPQSTSPRRRKHHPPCTTSTQPPAPRQPHPRASPTLPRAYPRRPTRPPPPHCRGRCPLEPEAAHEAERRNPRAARTATLMTTEQTERRRRPTASASESSLRSGTSSSGTRLTKRTLNGSKTGTGRTSLECVTAIIPVKDESVFTHRSAGLLITAPPPFKRQTPSAEALKIDGAKQVGNSALPRSVKHQGDLFFLPVRLRVSTRREA